RFPQRSTFTGPPAEPEVSQSDYEFTYGRARLGDLAQEPVRVPVVVRVPDPVPRSGPGGGAFCGGGVAVVGDAARRRSGGHRRAGARDRLAGFRRPVERRAARPFVTDHA